MLEVKGKYGTALVYTDNIDELTIGQIIDMLNQKWAENSHMRIMPDTHVGKGATIGTTFVMQDALHPNVVGVDIGCGVTVVNTKITDFDVKKIENYVKRNIPFGMTINKKPVYDFSDEIKKLKCYQGIAQKLDMYNKSLMSVGGGNHFFEGNINSKNELYLSVHSGSRNLGNLVAKYYIQKAIENPDKLKSKIREEIDKLKKENRHTEIEQSIEIIKKEYVKESQEAISGDTLKDYLHDIAIIQKYADINRKLILNNVLTNYFKLSEKEIEKLEFINSVHNYIDLENNIVRKGAISAKKDEKLVIPMNMRDGILVCVGKGNDEWNQSAPHGAGRLYSRGKAKELFTLEEFKETMKDVYSTTVNQSTIDESPMAYKPTEEIMTLIKDTVEILEVLKPVFNVKASN